MVALICSAGLAALPVEPFEAAIVDGANAWQRFRYLTLPLLMAFPRPMPSRGGAAPRSASYCSPARMAPGIAFLIPLFVACLELHLVGGYTSLISLLWHLSVQETEHDGLALQM